MERLREGAEKLTAPSSGDMPPEEFRRYAHETADWIAGFLARVDDVPVYPEVEAGDLIRQLPVDAPTSAEPMDEILRDFRELVFPGLTHWNHPAFFGYFAISASGPGILAEMLAAALNVNAMVWRSSPAATELEGVATAWLRRMLGLPQDFEGVINDTASSSSLYALAAARERTYPKAHDEGLFGQPIGRVYGSDQAHSSIEKAVLTLGLGRGGYRAITSDAEFRMDPVALRAAIEEDRQAGVRPVAIVATLGTTSTASIDPIAEIAEIAAAEDVWLHVDAAYGGPVAVLPEMAGYFSGWETADSIVVNPHKWLFTPIDCSVLYCRRPQDLVKAFSIVPEYLSSREGDGERSLMDYGVSLGRRFRSLKLWFVLRYFGRTGIESRLREHLELAALFANWVEEADEWSLEAPVHLGTIAYRFAPGWADSAVQDALNLRIAELVNASGQAFLTHTSVGGRIVLRLSIGNLRTTHKHVAGAWALLRQAAVEATAGLA
ncbi:MAG: pyridoxal-dependent decarboxylase [Gemmatimonadota bacterium]|nr:pyridoxal-dependent decarboxylase [Gemmatimonadota bacterium]